MSSSVITMATTRKRHSISSESTSTSGISVQSSTANSTHSSLTNTTVNSTSVSVHNTTASSVHEGMTESTQCAGVTIGTKTVFISETLVWPEKWWMARDVNRAGEIVWLYQSDFVQQNSCFCPSLSTNIGHQVFWKMGSVSANSRNLFWDGEEFSSLHALMRPSSRWNDYKLKWLVLKWRQY